jgi:hypothetical protein
VADTSVIRRASVRPDEHETRDDARAATTLDTWSQFQWSDGVQIDRLVPLSAIDVRTRNTLYRLTVLDGASGEVLVTGGHFFPTATRARLNGCTAGGSCLKWRGVYRGFRIEFQIGTEVVVTTRVASIELVDRSDGAASVH